MNQTKGNRSPLAFIAAGLLLASLAGAACSVLTVRPVQEMSDTAAALRAAREVQADTLAPELYRQASDWFFKAKREYKFKNFDLAKAYADKSRRLAEDAEFESLRNGGNRTDPQIADPMSNGIAPPPGQPVPPPMSPSGPYPYPTPTGTPADQGTPGTGGAPGGP